MIAGVTEFGLFVDIEGYFVQGLLHVSDLGADYLDSSVPSSVWWGSATASAMAG